MTRTTVDIEAPILKEVKRLQKEQGLPMGKIISRLLADALARQRHDSSDPDFRWVSRKMNPLFDVADKEAVYSALDRDDS